MGKMKEVRRRRGVSSALVNLTARLIIHLLDGRKSDTNLAEARVDEKVK